MSILAVACLCAFAAACQMANGPISESAFTPSNNPVTVETVTRNDRLAEIARAQHPRILATYGGEYSDPKLERMVAKIVGNLTTASGDPDQTYRITILNSPNINAFALPGGYLYVTRGLLALANDSAELATVIAHEMGHVTANHGIQRQKKEAEEQLASRVVGEVLGGGGSVAQASLVRGKLRLAQFSRNQELQADEIGIRTTAKAGYDAYSAARFLQAMAAYSDLRSVSGAHDTSLDFLASHPNAPQRIDLARRHAREYGPEGTGRRDRDSFLEGVDGLLFGDKPEEGYVRGNTFQHPGLGISFSVPEGFVIDNSATAVTAAGPGDVAIRFDGVALRRNIKLTDYLQSGWVGGLDGNSVRAVTINGNEAATARARSDGWQFAVTVVRADDRVYRLLTAAPASSSALEPTAQLVGNSFHLLSAAERRALKPLRVRVVTVRPGQNVASLAAQMKGVGRAQELFRLINALPPGGGVSAGDRVKIVTDR
ncbi:M48 family metalloprotease [Mesorhizobium xinjiangense]|uniref:M48 family metalloprotease n=1 Tax=Mesorhizobium xinjiangense TaxID=2678685 RepID=UPI0012ED5077|nr:M48 family metalloprotease [Mesorhizobium xinjiangense]